MRRYTSALIDTFNDLHIKRFKNDGTVDNDYIVPVKFGSAQKAFTLSEDDFSKYRESKYNIVPRIALSFDGMSRASERDTNKLNKTIKFHSDEKTLTYSFNSVSWTMDFTLSILADTFTDLTMIIEQIVPMFNPTYSLKMKDLDFHDEYRNVPLRLSGVSTNLDIDLSMDDDIRFVTAELNLSIDANLYPPIKDGKIINHVILNLYDGVEPIPKGDL
jgi:hypothetical protein